MLRQLPPMTDPALLVGPSTGDDAAVYRLTDELALVQTVDFFPPIVDDPFAYGEIAAANAISDVYAMGGTPMLALNVAAFPVDLPVEVLGEVMRGAASKAAEAGVIVVGGHTVDDQEPKFGMAVTGVVEPGREVTNAGAKPGDAARAHEAHRDGRHNHRRQAGPTPRRRSLRAPWSAWARSTGTPLTPWSRWA